MFTFGDHLHDFAAADLRQPKFDGAIMGVVVVPLLLWGVLTRRREEPLPANDICLYVDGWTVIF